MNIPTGSLEEFHGWLMSQLLYGDSFVEQLYEEIKHLKQKPLPLLLAPEIASQIAKETAGLIINGGTFNLRDLAGGDIAKRDEVWVGRDMNKLDVGENASVEEAVVGQGTQQKE